MQKRTDRSRRQKEPHDTIRGTPSDPPTNPLPSPCIVSITAPLLSSPTARPEKEDSSNGLTVVRRCGEVPTQSTKWQKEKLTRCDPLTDSPPDEKQKTEKRTDRPTTTEENPTTPPTPTTPPNRPSLHPTDCICVHHCPLLSSSKKRPEEGKKQ
mmetsp:Transcript_37241/g.106548  ORF Transcript_37241/g.106548 Transcript_37241/m.106548 type:complete len:154 (+) Transcript_37241:311-772(+)